MSGSPLQRFWSKIKLEPNGCWLWLGSRSGKRRDYGQLKVDGRMQYVHRLAYEWFKGPIPPGLVLDHVVCKNTACANPNHVEPVTQLVNVRRGQLPRTHCKREHALTRDNVYRNRQGRTCRQCALQRAKERATRKAS